MKKGPVVRGRRVWTDDHVRWYYRDMPAMRDWLLTERAKQRKKVFK